jgi:hypothetical protein
MGKVATGRGGAEDEVRPLLLCLGDILHTGDALRSTGGCMRGQGPRVGKPSIFPTAQLRCPIITGRRRGEPAECTWYIASLGEHSAICLGVAALGEHAVPLAEDWATPGKVGRVWYVTLRGSEPGRPGGGSFMDGSRVVSSSSALFANESTIITLRWQDYVMSVLINEKLVGTIRTDTGGETEEGQDPPALRFAAQFWQDNDQIVLQSHNLQNSRWLPRVHPLFALHLCMSNLSRALKLDMPYPQPCLQTAQAGSGLLASRISKQTHRKVDGATTSDPFQKAGQLFGQKLCS